GREVDGVGDQWNRMVPLGRRLGGSGRIIDFRMNILFATVAPLKQGPAGPTSELASARYRILIPAQQLARSGHQVQLAVLPPGGWPRQVVEAPCDVLVISKSFHADNEALAQSMKARGVRVVV